MTPTQQQIVGAWNHHLQQTGASLQQLLHDAAKRCETHVAQSPTDEGPLGEALVAVEAQVESLRAKVDEAFSEHHARACREGPEEPARMHMKRAMRAFHRWAEESWQRFDTHLRVQQYRAMWSHVQTAMHEPSACSRCGARLSRGAPHKLETLVCPSCNTSNDVLPSALVVRYYAGMPHSFAASTILDLRVAIRRFQYEWEDFGDAEVAAGRPRPAEPLERLRHREQLERECWNAYARARVENEGGSADDVRVLVDARMKECFYDEMAMNDVWQSAHPRPSSPSATSRSRSRSHARANENATTAEPRSAADPWGPLDEWGPLDPKRDPNALEDDCVHEHLLNEARQNPAEHARLLRRLGYRDAEHRAMVHATFERHYADYLQSTHGQALVTKAQLRATNERKKYA